VRTIRYFRLRARRRLHGAFFSAGSQEEVAWRLCAPLVFNFFGLERVCACSARLESSEGDRRAATARMEIEENWLRRGPVPSSMRGACIEGLRLAAADTLKRYSKALEYEYRVKTAAPSTLKRYSIFSLTLYLE
jgi:hypothetical protein